MNALKLLAYGADYPPAVKWGAALLFAAGLIWCGLGMVRFYIVWPPCPGKVIYAKRMCSCRSGEFKFFITTHVMVTDERLMLYVADGGRGAALSPGRGFVLRSPSRERMMGGTAYTFLLGIYDAKLGTSPDGRGNVVLSSRQPRDETTAEIFLTFKNPQEFLDAYGRAQSRDSQVAGMRLAT